MPREIQQFLVSVAVLALAISTSAALILLPGRNDWVVDTSALVLTLSLFLPIDYEEG